MCQNVVILPSKGHVDYLKITINFEAKLEVSLNCFSFVMETCTWYETFGQTL